MEEVNGNVGGKKKFTKTAHLFAHRKNGCQKRFERVYKELRDKVSTAWLQDLQKLEQEFGIIAKSNQALAGTKIDRAKEMASTVARTTMKTVFDEWRQEINRIITELHGYPQEDGTILFPDGSLARMPKGLFIPKEIQLQF